MAIDPNIKQKADDIRTKVYGSEVRESLASGLEAMSSDVVETVGRQGNVESQFQDVIENTTDKDVISAPEIIAARNGEANLKARLDKNHNEVTAQLDQTERDVALKINRSEVQSFLGDGGIRNAIWSWWTHPLAIHKDGKTLITWTDNEGGCWVGKFDHSDKSFDKMRVIQNEVDDHNAPNVLLMADNRAITFYSRHNKDTLLRYRRSATAGSIDFGSEQTINFPANVTYAQACLDSAGRLHTFTRVGSSTWHYLRSDDNGATWAVNRKIVDFGGGNQAYLRIKLNKSENRIKIAFSGHPFIGQIHDVYFCEINTETGAMLVNGQTIGNVSTGSSLPLSPSQLFKVYDADVTGKKARLFDISEHSEIAFAEFADDDSGVYKYARRSSNGFTTHTVANTGRTIGGGAGRNYFGGMNFPSGTEGEVYLSREHNGIWRIEKAVTADGGETWSFTEISASDKEKMFRPYAPIDAHEETPVIWANGQYSEENFTEFDTDLTVPGMIGGVIAEIKNSVARISERGATQSVTLQEGWGGTLNYSLNGIGQVYLRGRISTGIKTKGTVIGVLPEGYRPEQHLVAHLIDANDRIVTAALMIAPSGSIVTLEPMETAPTAEFARVNTIFHT